MYCRSVSVNLYATTTSAKKKQGKTLSFSLTLSFFGSCNSADPCVQPLPGGESRPRNVGGCTARAARALPPVSSGVLLVSPADVLQGCDKVVQNLCRNHYTVSVGGNLLRNTNNAATGVAFQVKKKRLTVGNDFFGADDVVVHGM